MIDFYLVTILTFFIILLLSTDRSRKKNSVRVMDNLTPEQRSQLEITQVPPIMNAHT